MARIARVVAPKHPHHVTQRGVRSLPIFRNDGDREAYLQFLREESERFGVEVLAWCLMTNHVHLILVPSDSGSLAKAVGLAHKRYTRMLNFAEGVRGFLFQGRFGSCVLSEGHLLAAVRYVERNPVRAGMAERAWEYPWSSAGFHVGERAGDALARDRSLWGLLDGSRGYLEEEDGTKEVDWLRQATRTGRPVGDGRFLGQLRRVTGRDLRKRPAGRPRGSQKRK